MSVFGQIGGICLAFIGLGGGLFLAYKGCAMAGLSAFIGTLGTLAAAVIYNRRQDAKDKAEAARSAKEAAETA